MIKMIYKTTLFCLCLYVCFWCYQNLDIESVIYGTKNSFKYELSNENINQTINSVKHFLK